jgi:hypothetical protein
VLLLAGCASPPPAPKPAPVPVALTINTPIHLIAANPRGKAVLLQDLPHLMSSPSYPLFDDMSLTQIATLSGGRLTQAKLALVQADLAEIPPAP